MLKEFVDNLVSNVKQVNLVLIIVKLLLENVILIIYIKNKVVVLDNLPVLLDILNQSTQKMEKLSVNLSVKLQELIYLQNILQQLANHL